jgi:hypothetical protein
MHRIKTFNSISSAENEINKAVKEYIKKTNQWRILYQYISLLIGNEKTNKNLQTIIFLLNKQSFKDEYPDIDIDRITNCLKLGHGFNMLNNPIADPYFNIFNNTDPPNHLQEFLYDKQIENALRDHIIITDYSNGSEINGITIKLKPVICDALDLKKNEVRLELVKKRFLLKNIYQFDLDKLFESEYQ